MNCSFGISLLMVAVSITSSTLLSLLLLSLSFSTQSLPVQLLGAYVVGAKQEGQGESQEQRQDDQHDKVAELQQWYRQSRQQRSQGNYQQAIELAKKVLGEVPTDTGLLVHTGSCHYMLGQMKEAVDFYDQAIQAEPTLKPQLWQRGLALFYLGRFKDGQEQFETHQTYNTQDVENAVWHMLCQAKASDLKTARQELIPIQRDTRVPMKQIHQLYAGQASTEDVIAAAKSTKNPTQRTEAMYYAHLYTGLYQEMIGQNQQSLESMKQADKINPLPKQYLMGQVASVHLKLRGESEESPKETVPAEQRDADK